MKKIDRLTIANTVANRVTLASLPDAFPDDVTVERTGAANAAAMIRAFLSPADL